MSYLGCTDSNLGAIPIGQQVGVKVTSTAANFIPVVGPVLSPIISILGSLFGGGPTKEEKQSGVYLDTAKKYYNKYARLDKKLNTPEKLLDAMIAVSLDKAGKSKGLCPKYCPGSPCSGAEGRGCQYILPYNLYKTFGGPRNFKNPAYSTFGGGEKMVRGTLRPFFKKMLDDPSFAPQICGQIPSPIIERVKNYCATGSLTGKTLSSGGGTNLLPLLLIGGIIVYVSKRKS